MPESESNSPMNPNAPPSLAGPGRSTPGTTPIPAGQDPPQQTRSDPDGNGTDEAWDDRARHETPVERLDRNWSDLLQETRVVQTGVQLLTGFLLTLPFQPRFATLPSFQQDLYLAVVIACIISTGLLIAPVPLHRMLFRLHARSKMVEVANRLAVIGLSFLGLALVGVAWLIFDVVRGPTVGLIAACAATVLISGLWLALPIVARLSRPEEPWRGRREPS